MYCVLVRDFEFFRVIRIDADRNLDGGGVRSYSSLSILKALMERVKSVLLVKAASRREKNTYRLNGNTNMSRLRRADIFGFMCGSSSGEGKQKTFGSRRRVVACRLIF